MDSSTKVSQNENSDLYCSELNWNDEQQSFLMKKQSQIQDLMHKVNARNILKSSSSRSPYLKQMPREKKNQKKRKTQQYNIDSRFFGSLIPSIPKRKRHDNKSISLNRQKKNRINSERNSSNFMKILSKNQQTMMKRMERMEGDLGSMKNDMGSMKNDMKSIVKILDEILNVVSINNNISKPHLELKSESELDSMIPEVGTSLYDKQTMYLRNPVDLFSSSSKKSEEIKKREFQND